MPRYLVLIALVAAISAQAEDTPGAPPRKPNIGDTSRDQFGSPQRFGAFEENYILLGNWMRNNGWAGPDERAMRAHYSLRYVFIGREANNCNESTWVCTTWQAFLAYTGEFDFYMGTRDSGPVINRLSNPGLHAQWRPSALFKPTEDSYLSASIEHASDGQVTEIRSTAEAQTAQQHYDGRTREDRAYFDTISRGSNFIGLGARVVDAGVPGLTLSAKLRRYLTQDSSITWGPLAGTGVRLSDYHRASVSAEYAASRRNQFQLRWTVGDKGLATDSFDIGWRNTASWGEVFSLPLYVRYHHGPLNTLSNYTQRQDSIGIGLRFDDF